MKPIRTLSGLQDFLDKESAWRLKELADLKLSIHTNATFGVKTFTRAAVPLAYAHWEGFVKRVATAYVNYVDSQGYKYQQLNDCFIALGAKKHTNSILTSNQTRDGIQVVKFFLDQMGGVCSLNYSRAINTESNLSSSVFENIIATIGVAPTAYSTHYKFMDERLLKRRNEIAHGDYLDLTSDDCRALIDNVISLMSKFKSDVESCASSKLFLRRSTVGASVHDASAISPWYCI